MKKIVASIIITMTFSVFVHAQTDTAHIKTSAICETCKKTIESYLSFEKGVKKSNLDLETKMISVIYDPKKTDIDKIRLAITKSGYDADSIPRNPKAYKRLPECCKDGGMPEK
jgi:mercuric ion binding protein